MAASLNTSLWQILSVWFGLARRVGRVDYLTAGLLLTAIKYVGEATLFWTVAGRLLTPVAFAIPLLGVRESMLSPAPPWVLWLLYVWTLPFLWVAVSMSIRRAADAGRSPWLGFLVLLPVVNLVLMFGLCIARTAPGENWKPDRSDRHQGEPIWHAAVSVALGVLLGGVMIAISIYGLSSYGASLFVGTPLLMGATSSWFFNRRQPQTFAASAGIGALTVISGFMGMFLFALEGVICLIMTVPMAMPVAALGALLGKAIADTSRRPDWEMAGTLCMLPLWAYGETLPAKETERVVLTTVHIDAPPSAVWQQVVSFPELPAKRAWYFRLGIACPERARIVGSGVGATRYCEFSTGSFVEPITVWDEPRRLAFDVTRQPPPMFELSPYPDVHPPHLTGFLQSTRGEFQLIALPSGGTRLEGRTWYRSSTYPAWYWSAWYDLWIHKIHQRVLKHVKGLSEADSSLAIRNASWHQPALAD